MTRIPASIEEAMAAQGEFRAGGSDLQQRLRSGVSSGPVVDLRGLTALSGVSWDEEGRARIGALTPIATLASDPRLAAAYPGLARSAAALATPQIRAAGTFGGNLLQRNRCWYFRHPRTSCFKKGGNSCPAREGNHLLSSCFDLGPCVAPHPSTLAMALLAYEAQVEVAGSGMRALAALYGDGSDARRDHQLGPHEVLTAALMPAPLAGERAAYFRATARAAAEWPLAEALVRLGLAGGRIAFARVAVGGVAPIPLRRERVEAALLSQPADGETLRRAASHAREGAIPLPMSAYKVDLLCGTVQQALEQALG
ncbi:MAG TPA: FAD binding domain-containing protein [Burkholderiales bacterium]|nr:FAD binding domain-containing protein [Burkholderiales bacterium]